MSPPPERPKLYHIVHVDRLASIVHDDRLICDATIGQRGETGTVIGMSAIKLRRQTLPVSCHTGRCVGDFVPFYFCPRSIMLYLIYMANHPELAYRGGQGSIIHLEADLQSVVAWATAEQRPWAFSLSNAGSSYAQFRGTVGELDQINWDAVAARDFRPSETKEGKQAEFLVLESLPWRLIERIGVESEAMVQRVSTILMGAAHRPPVELRRDWYY